MAEVERYETDIPFRVVVLQGWGHGPVYIRCPGVTMAYCVQPGCMWRGEPRPVGSAGDELRESDARAHLDMHVTGTKENPW